MLQLAFLSVLLCSQYAAGTPVMFSVHGQGPDDSLRLNIVPATWTEADLHCQLEGGVLASPTTSALAQAMKTAMADHKLSSSVFIGVTDLLSKGDFRSLDGASVADIPLEWAAGEPNNAGNAEQCLALTGAGALADVSCSAALPYFCLKKGANIGDSTPEVPSYNGSQALKKGADIGDSTPEVPSCNGRQDYEWEPRTGSCYKFHGLAEIGRLALETCRTEEGYLAIINNQTEATVLKEIHDKNKKHITGAYDNDFTSRFYNVDIWPRFSVLMSQTEVDEYFKSPNNEDARLCWSSDKWTGLDKPEDAAWCQRKYPYICEITP